MKGISILISAACLTAAPVAFAGAGCQYGHDALAQSSPIADSGLVISQTEDARVDPKWLALIKEQELGAQNQTKPIVIHN